MIPVKVKTIAREGKECISESVILPQQDDVIMDCI